MKLAVDVSDDDYGRVAAGDRVFEDSEAIGFFVEDFRSSED